MNNKRLMIGSLLTGALLLVTAAGNSFSADQAIPPEGEITIAGKKPARFSHPVHLAVGLDCASCHHDQQHNPLSSEAIRTLEDTGVLRCVSCHNSDHPNPDLQKPKDLFHAKCKNCHKEGFAGKKGPTKCTSCHLKKKKTYEGC